MNITFMIGNGFDLNLNLKTSYKDFYKYYIEKMKNDKDDIILKSIKSNYELWADLELGLGHSLKNLQEENLEDFFDSKSNLESILTEYLTKENDRFVILDENKFVEEFTKKILGFTEGFSATEKEQFKTIVSKTSEEIKYQFITFNYTTVLDKMIELVQSRGNQFSSHSAGSVGYGDTLCEPHHIHGTLDGEDLILCVDNLVQIDNEILQSDRRINDYMIKTNVNNALGERKIEIAKEIIDNSRYICLFGLSLGDTDTTWWKYLAKWLNRSENNRLVLFVRDNAKIKRSGSENIRIRNKYRAIFGKNSQCIDTDIYDKIRDRIIIVRNSDIFTYKYASVEESIRKLVVNQ